MKSVFLIRAEDRYCPENNNGDHIIGILSNKVEAEVLAKELTEASDWQDFIVWEKEIDNVDFIKQLYLRRDTNE